jgi:hypothetical protein
VAAAGAADDQLFAAAVVACEAVIPVRGVQRQAIDPTEPRAVLEGQLAGGGKGRGTANDGDRRRVPRLLVRLEAHRRQDGRAHLGGDRPPLAEYVDVGRLDQLTHR